MLPRYRPTRCPVLAYGALPTRVLRDVRYWNSVWCSAMPGTEIAYGSGCCMSVTGGTQRRLRSGEGGREGGSGRRGSKG
eukprot:906845-Rhodomonas_salina.2